MLNEPVTGLGQEHGKHRMTHNWWYLMSFLRCQEILMPQPTWFDCELQSVFLVQTILKLQMLDWQHFVCRYHDSRKAVVFNQNNDCYKFRSQSSPERLYSIEDWKHVQRFTRITHLHSALCQVPVRQPQLLTTVTLLVSALLSHLDFIK